MRRDNKTQGTMTLFDHCPVSSDFDSRKNRAGEYRLRKEVIQQVIQINEIQRGDGNREWSFGGNDGKSRNHKDTQVNTNTVVQSQISHSFGPEERPWRIRLPND